MKNKNIFWKKKKTVSFDFILKKIPTPWPGGSVGLIHQKVGNSIPGQGCMGGNQLVSLTLMSLSLKSINIYSDEDLKKLRKKKIPTTNPPFCSVSIR